MIKYSFSFFILIACLFSSRAQDTIPHIKGKVIISVTRGTMECDLTLSNIPKISDYYIRLNAGMNMRNIKNPNGYTSLYYDKTPYDSLATGEAAAYFLRGSNGGKKYLPRELEFTYTGMYPVITDTGSAEDWKGNIAFNGNTIRTDGNQTAWYPILYDIKNDLAYTKVTYDLDITCADCKNIYLNGSEPVTATHAVFKSNTPQELTMFSGNYTMAAINGTHFLNSGMDEKQLVSFEKLIHAFKEYYEKNLQIPYKGNAVYIQTTPVSKHNSWLFASYPTIIGIGLDDNNQMKNFVDPSKSSYYEPYMAHELGHYYFGSYRFFNSEMGDMMSEGFAEYLSLNLTRKLISDSLYKAKLTSKYHALRNFKPVSFTSVRSKNDYNDRELYVYYYAPLIFTAIEKEIGEPVMWNWIRALLQTPVELTNYHFLEQTLNDVLKDKTQMDLIRSKYFTGDAVVKNVAATLQISDASQTSASAGDQKAKTYYYFFFARPIEDAGSPENRIVKHSEILEITGTPAEISQMSERKFKHLTEACENEAGCSSDFNTYETMEQAKAALVRWRKPYADNPKFVIKTIVL